jgi:Fe-S cluster assembly iron-binding protein IscA
MGMTLDEPKKDEQTITINGLDVLVEDFVKPFIDGTTIDYINKPQGEGFVIAGAGGDC